MTFIEILEQIKNLHKVFLRPESQETLFKDGVKAIAGVTCSAVLLVDKEGTILADAIDEIETDEYFKSLVKEESLAGDSFLQTAVKTEDTLMNILYPDEAVGKKQAPVSAMMGSLFTVIPIKSEVNKVATLFLYHPTCEFDTDVLILAEAGAALIGMSIIHRIADQEEEEIRNRELAEGAFESLSYSEVEAIREILKNISNNESIVVASKIADGLGITRSVIVNALRKFESAGIIESRSLGMKGTFIRVKNLHALELVASRSNKMGHIR